jgi:hypothetical protein
MNKVYDVKASFVQSGVFKIRAENREEAQRIAREYCYWAFDSIRTSADDQVIDWEFPLTPEKIIGKITRNRDESGFKPLSV